MRIVRLGRVLSEVHPGVLFQRLECTYSCGCISRNSGTLGCHKDELLDKLKLTVDSQEGLAIPAPGRPCPIVTKDGVTRLFIICLDLIRARKCRRGRADVEILQAWLYGAFCIRAKRVSCAERDG